MTIDEIKKLPLSEVKELYCEYLRKQNLSPKTIRTSCSNAFYILKHDKTIDFWELLASSDFEKITHDYLEVILSKYSNGKVKSNINGYMSHIRKLRNFAHSDFSIDKSLTKSKIMIDTKSKLLLKNISQKIPTPSGKEVERYLELWNNLENYKLQESALDKLFFKLVPTNTSISDILIKAATLNDFYSTNIFSIFTVSQHILSLNIDDRLKVGDERLVDDMKNIVINNNNKAFYSFATKYCSHHNPADFPIYDSFVDKVLRHFRNVDGFSNFKNYELKTYTKFKSILHDFQIFYGLENYSLKDLDKFLWQFGKEYFPKDYNKKNSK